MSSKVLFAMLLTAAAVTFTAAGEVRAGLPLPPPPPGLPAPPGVSINLNGGQPAKVYKKKHRGKHEGWDNGKRSGKHGKKHK